MKDTLPKETPGYSLDASIVHYMCFPEYGVALAIRPGDVLLFNPQHYHCLSEKEVEYAGQSDDVYATSFYLKTSVICKNDNSVLLNEEEEERHASILLKK